MLTVYITSLLLIGLSGYLLDMHRRSWRDAQNDPSLSDRDRRFARSQYRRRMQASAIIGVLGAAVGIYPLVQSRLWPMVIYAASLLGACVSIMLLAALDAWASRQNYLRLRNEQLADQVKLARELSRNDG